MSYPPPNNPGHPQQPPYPPYPPYPPRRPESWFKRNMIWFLPTLLICGLMPLICCGGLMLGAFQLKDYVTAPFNATVEALSEDSRVTDKMGLPLERGNQIAVNDLQYNNGDGFCNVDFEIDGPDGSAMVSGRINAKNGVWTPGKLTITFDDGTVINYPEGSGDDSGKAAGDTENGEDGEDDKQDASDKIKDILKNE